MKIYIAGKIGDLPQVVYEAKFKQAEEAMRSHGYEVVNPCKLPHNHNKQWSSYMLENLTALSSCDGIFMLHNWCDSPGAKIEHAWAHRMGLLIYYQTPEHI